jgi:ActR/RegA family two-component response regulator
MKPWEHKGTIEALCKMSGEETIKIGVSLTEDALNVLISSIYHECPESNEEMLWEEVKRVIWEIDKETSKIASSILQKHLKE